MNARSIVARVVEELQRRGITVVAEAHNTSVLAALHHPVLDGPTAFILVLSPEDHTGWHAAERTGDDEYAAIPSRLDRLRPDAPISDVVDAIQTHLENRLPHGADPVTTIESLRVNHPNDRPMLLVLRGNPEACDTVVAWWLKAARNQFDHSFCFDANDYRVVHRIHPVVDTRRLLRDFLQALDVRAPSLSRYEDPGYLRELYDRYQDAVAGQRIVVHLHNATEPAQVTCLAPKTPGGLLIATTRDTFPELALDGAYFLDV